MTSIVSYWLESGYRESHNELTNIILQYIDAQ